MRVSNTDSPTPEEGADQCSCLSGTTKQYDAVRAQTFLRGCGPCSLAQNQHRFNCFSMRTPEYKSRLKNQGAHRFQEDAGVLPIQARLSSGGEPTRGLSLFHFTPVRISRRSCRSWLMVGILLVSLLPSTVLASFLNPKYGQTPASPYEIWENEMRLDGEGKFILQWTPSHDRIIFRVTANTRGYIGFGLSTEARMEGADMVVGWVHSGKAYLQDRHGKSNQAPSVDRQQDWDLIGGYENDTHTVLLMSRPYSTCDPNDHTISNDTIRLLYAYHPDDPVDPGSPRPRLHYHGILRRGTATLFLLQRPRQMPSSAPMIENYPKLHFHRDHFENLQHPSVAWSLVGPPAVIDSASDSVHWCRLFRRPQLSRKHHVVRYEPVFDGGNAHFVQHMMVYECIRLNNEDEMLLHELAGTNGSLCSDRDMSQFLSACNHVVVAWSYGSQGVWLPDEAGYPLSPEGPTFYMLETHYDIPQEEPLVDASGIRLMHTPILRNFDAGVLSVGLDPNWKHLIPPRQQTVLSEGHCIKECLGMALPSSGINVFGVIFHTHLLGRRMRLRHMRGDTEFEPIAIDNNYDFAYQEYRALRESRKVLPGDHLIGECVYNSQERSSITLGGFKTRDEMCLSFLFYWPRIDLSLCHSKPSLSTVLQSLGIEELSDDSNPITIKKPIELAGKTLKWRLQNYDWVNQFDHFQQATSEGTFNPMCLSRGRRIVPEMDDVDYGFPNISKEWTPHNVCERERRRNRKKKKQRGRGGSSTGGPRRSNGAPQRPEETENGHEDVMFDDETSYKPIEMVDVDPKRTFDMFMPVIGGSGSDSSDVIGVEPVNLGGSSQANEMKKEYPDLMEELDQMEKDLENEIHNQNHRNAHHGLTDHQNPHQINEIPDVYQERSSHSPSSSSCCYVCSSYLVYLQCFTHIVWTLVQLRPG